MTGWRITIATILVVHGIGHSLGIVPAFATITDTWTTRSWLLSGRLGASGSRLLAVALWFACLTGFVASGLALLGAGMPPEWWEPLAVGSGLLSLATLLLFWNGFPVLFPNKIGAIAVDLTAVIGILFASWPGDGLLGL